ncbi:hypothetical protein ACLKA6_001141 [Drosophila palustris]
MEVKSDLTLSRENVNFSFAFFVGLYPPQWTRRWQQQQLYFSCKRGSDDLSSRSSIDKCRRARQAAADLFSNRSSIGLWAQNSSARPAVFFCIKQHQKHQQQKQAALRQQYYTSVSRSNLPPHTSGSL